MKKTECLTDCPPRIAEVGQSKLSIIEIENRVLIEPSELRDAPVGVHRGRANGGEVRLASKLSGFEVVNNIRSAFARPTGGRRPSWLLTRPAPAICSAHSARRAFLLPDLGAPSRRAGLSNNWRRITWRRRMHSEKGAVQACA